MSVLICANVFLSVFLQFCLFKINGRLLADFFCCFGKFWKLLVCRLLVKGCKIFCKKVGKKFGMRGKTAVPLQPQTGNGGSRPRKQVLRGLRGREKVVTFAVPPFGCGERTLK